MIGTTRNPRWRRTLGLLAGGLALVLVSLACTRTTQIAAPTPPSSGPEATRSVADPGQQIAAAQQVDITLFVFSPTPLRVPAGTTVTWRNQDAIEHSVTHGSKEQPGNAFDSGLFSEGQTYAYTFTERGTFTYFCTRHPHMQGEIKVE